MSPKKVLIITLILIAFFVIVVVMVSAFVDINKQKTRKSAPSPNDIKLEAKSYAKPAYIKKTSKMKHVIFIVADDLGECALN
jgi:flagellar basal body-associated protein FliL